MRMKALLGGAGFAALLLLGSLPAQSQPWSDCRERIARAEARYERAADRFGRHSDRAREERRKLEDIRDRCRGHDRDWDRHDRYDHHDHWH